MAMASLQNRRGFSRDNTSSSKWRDCAKRIPAKDFNRVIALKYVNYVIVTIINKLQILKKNTYKVHLTLSPCSYLHWFLDLLINTNKTSLYSFQVFSKFTTQNQVTCTQNARKSPLSPFLQKFHSSSSSPFLLLSSKQPYTSRKDKGTW